VKPAEFLGQMVKVLKKPSKNGTRELMKNSEEEFAYDFSGLTLNDLLHFSVEIIPNGKENEFYEAIQSEVHKRVKAGEK